MQENQPSETALRVARRRAAHQVYDRPVIFEDPLALRIIGFKDAEDMRVNSGFPEDDLFLIVLRASLAARSRFAEDELRRAVHGGVRQYVILGAGLDTFAYRNPYATDLPRVFEVDHPATQAWKRSLLAAADIGIPDCLTFVPVDFHETTLAEGLRRAGLDGTQPAFFSWLGVTPYLTGEAIEATLRFVAAGPAGSGIVFDYMIAPSLIPPTSMRAFEGLSRMVAAAGEPFQSFFDPEALRADLRAKGFREIEDLGPAVVNERFFQGRTDGLRAGSLAHLMSAWV